MVTGYKDKIPDDIALMFKPDFERSEMIEAFQQLAKVSTNRPKSIVIEVNIYRRYVPMMIRAYCKQSELNKKAVMEVERCTDINYDRGNKRWTPEEDETLINLVCEGEYNIHKLSTMIGRSPGAIQSHISYLVGRKRLSQEVAGKFIGKINGEETQADIVGTIYK